MLALHSSYDYAVVRVVPRPEREEFANAGVILHCLERRFLESRVYVDERRLSGALAGSRPGFNPAPSRSIPQNLRRRPWCWPDCQTLHQGALPMARGPSEHDHSGIPRP